MIHRNSKNFFAQWTRQRRLGLAAPDPSFGAGIGEQLDKYRFDIRPAQDGGFRIVELGSGVRDLLGRSPVGTPFNWLFHVGEREEVGRIVRGAFQDGSGLVMGAQGTLDTGARVSIEIILLPAQIGAPLALIGCFSPLSDPFGADSAKPVGLLRLVSMRVPLVPEAPAIRPSARLRAAAGYTVEPTA